MDSEIFPRIRLAKYEAMAQKDRTGYEKKMTPYSTKNNSNIEASVPDPEKDKEDEEEAEDEEDD